MLVLPAVPWLEVHFNLDLNIAMSSYEINIPVTGTGRRIPGVLLPSKTLHEDC